MQNIRGIQSAARLSCSKMESKMWCTCKSFEIPEFVFFNPLLKHSKYGFYEFGMSWVVLTIFWVAKVSKLKFQQRSCLFLKFIHCEKTTNASKCIEYWHSDADLMVFTVPHWISKPNIWLICWCRCQHLGFALSNLLSFQVRYIFCGGFVERDSYAWNIHLMCTINESETSYNKIFCVPKTMK